MEIKEKNLEHKNFKQKIEHLWMSLQNVGTDEKIFFTKNLSVMIRAGLALSHAFKILSQQTKNKKFQLALKKIEADVEAGNSLGDSLEKYPDIFSNVVVNMIKAGENSGQLEKVLGEVTDQMKKSRELVSKIKRALTYPVVIVGIMGIIGVFAVTYIIPKMMTIFVDMNVELPLPTKILIGLSNFLLRYGYIVLPLFLMILFLLWRSTRKGQGQMTLHSLFLKMPIAGSLVKKINIVKFSRTFSSLLASGIPLVQTFQITAKVLGNAVYREKVNQLAQETTKGIPVSTILAKYPDLFPIILTQMIEVGEKTGTLETILNDIIEFYEDDVDEILNNFATIIEPVIILLLGVGVAMMALAVIMPMYSLVQAV